MRVDPQAAAWRPAPAAFRITWTANGRTIPGARGRTLRAAPGLRGKLVRARVVAVRRGFADASTTSASRRLG